MNYDQMLDRVARAIHAADASHKDEPFDDVAEIYLDMAHAAIEELEATQKEQQ